MKFTHPSTVIVANAYVNNNYNQTAPQNVNTSISLYSNLYCQNNSCDVNLQNVKANLIDQK